MQNKVGFHELQPTVNKPILVIGLISGNMQQTLYASSHYSSKIFAVSSSLLFGVYFRAHGLHIFIQV